MPIQKDWNLWKWHALLLNNDKSKKLKFTCESWMDPPHKHHRGPCQVLNKQNKIDKLRMNPTFWPLCLL